MSSTQTPAFQPHPMKMGDLSSSRPLSRPTWQRCVASRMHSHGAWAEGGLGRDTTEDAEIAAAACRVMGLALATVERAADSACSGRP